jgi:hypothetical protein
MMLGVQKTWFRALAIFCAGVLIPGQVIGQAPAQQPTAQQAPAPAKPDANAAATAPAAPAPKRTADQLDSLVAPIALYPDPLLAQVLAASTYPLEVVQCRRWVQQNPNLKGDALSEAALKQPWDASIQALVVFPDALKLLDENLQWTTDLGNAVLDQQSDVMEAVQRMRKKAKDGGKLESTKEQKVEVKTVETKTVIEIQPTNPQVVYVPTYNPVVVYGPPVYAYPPIYYPPASYYWTAAISFGVGIAMGAAWGGYWGGGWGCGWGGNEINIDNDINIDRDFNGGDRNQINGGDRNNVNGGNRGNNTNAGNRANNTGTGNRAGNTGATNRAGNTSAGNRAAGGGGNSTWNHNPSHRKSVPYSSNNTAQKFGGSTRDAAGNMTRFDSKGQQRSTVSRSSLGNTQSGNFANRAATNQAGARNSPAAGNRASTANRASTGGADRIGNQSIQNRNSASQRSALGSDSRSRAQSSSSRGTSSLGSGASRAGGGGGISRGGGGVSRGGGGGRR